MKNVLFIVYYFPPMGGSGVQRPLKFVKYLRDFGWNPIVVCPEPGIYSHFDQALKKELEDINPELYRVSAKTLFHSAGSGAREVKGIPDFAKQKLRRLLRLFMYPDNKKGWIDPAVEKCLSLADEKKIDLIFSTAPPFSNHVAAARVKEKTGIPLVLDYRDAWLNNHFMKDLFGWQKKKMREIESRCLSRADAFTGLDRFMIRDMEESYPELKVKNRIIPHGYDADDFESSVQPGLIYKKNKLNILYSGLFYESNQPDIFLKGLSKAIKEGYFSKEDVHLHFQGGLDTRIQRLLDHSGFSEVYTDYGYIDHGQAVANIQQADLLWMISNFDPGYRQIKSGKLFEYIGSRKPILGLLHEGAASEILKDYKAGFVAPVDSVSGIAAKLGEIFSKWKEGTIAEADADFVQKYERKKITGELASLFNEISSGNQAGIS